MLLKNSNNIISLSVDKQYWVARTV